MTVTKSNPCLFTAESKVATNYLFSFFNLYTLFVVKMERTTLYFDVLRVLAQLRLLFDFLPNILLKVQP